MRIIYRLANTDVEDYRICKFISNSQVILRYISQTHKYHCQYFILNRKLHRIGGPALKSDGSEGYYIKGEIFKKEDYWERVNEDYL